MMESLTSLYNDDPFFSQERLLWPLRHKALSSLQQDFFNQRAKLVDSLLRELHDGPHILKPWQFPLIFSTLVRYVQLHCISVVDSHDWLCYIQTKFSNVAKHRRVARRCWRVTPLAVCNMS